MFCKKCGKELEDDFKVCPYCGTPVQKEETNEGGSDDYNVYGNSSYNHPNVSDGYSQQQYNQQQYNQPSYNQYPQQGNVKDTGSVWWGFLGLLSPLITFILYLMWRKTKPRTAKMLLVGTIVGLILGVITNIIAFNMFGDLNGGITSIPGDVPTGPEINV